MILTLPFPPSVNGYWRAPNKGSLKGRHLVSDRGRKFNSEALASILEQLNPKPRALTCDLSVSVVFYPPTQARRDLDNYFKALFDAMTRAGVWLDDSQIKKLSAEWGPVTKGGKVTLHISEVANAG